MAQLPQNLGKWHITENTARTKGWCLRTSYGKANLLLVDHRHKQGVVKPLKGKRYVARLCVNGRSRLRTVYAGFRTQRSAQIGVGLMKEKLTPILLRKVR